MTGFAVFLIYRLTNLTILMCFWIGKLDYQLTSNPRDMCGRTVIFDNYLITIAFYLFTAR